MRDETRRIALTQRIFGILADQPGVLLDQLLDRCPNATWNEVFTVVDHLSRTGTIRLSGEGMGRYHVELLAAQDSLETHK